MNVAILILNYNGKDLLLSYLDSVVTHKEDAEVWVVDNGSTDDSLVVVKKNFPKVKVLVLDKNYGYAKGYNLAEFKRTMCPSSRHSLSPLVRLILRS